MHKGIEITFNGEEVGYVSIEHRCFTPDDEKQGFNESLMITDTDHIKEMIQNEDIEYGEVNKLEFQIKDGCLIYQAKDNTGIVKQKITPLSSIQAIHTRRTSPLKFENKLTHAERKN